MASALRSRSTLARLDGVGRGPVGVGAGHGVAHLANDPALELVVADHERGVVAVEDRAERDPVAVPQRVAVQLVVADLDRQRVAALDPLARRAEAGGEDRGVDDQQRHVGEAPVVAAGLGDLQPLDVAERLDAGEVDQVVVVGLAPLEVVDVMVEHHRPAAVAVDRPEHAHPDVVGGLAVGHVAGGDAQLDAPLVAQEQAVLGVGAGALRGLRLGAAPGDQPVAVPAVGGQPRVR